MLAFWRLICDTFRKIVDSKYFGRGIMIAILVNTLSMGIEYHEQVGMQPRLALDNCFFPRVGSLLWLGQGDGEMSDGWGLQRVSTMMIIRFLNEVAQAGTGMSCLGRLLRRERPYVHT